MEVTRRSVLTKIGITPIETTKELQKDIKVQHTNVMALGALAAFEAGIVFTMAFLGKRQNKNVAYMAASRPSSICTEPSSASEDFYDEEVGE